LTTNPAVPNVVPLPFALGNVQFYGLLTSFAFDVAKLLPSDNYNYLLKRVPVNFAMATNNTIVWNGPNPYKIANLTFMNPTITLNFDSKSGEYDDLCFNGTCVWDLKQTTSSSGNNTWCNPAPQGKCYTYNKDNTAYKWYNLGSTSFLVAVTTISKAWNNS
jgi:hypothetical protein